MNTGGHLGKSGGQNPQNSKKQGGHGKPWALPTIPSSNFHLETGP